MCRPTCSNCSRCLKSMLSRRGGDLSGGQQQQLAIGRALVTRPKVLVLDEPTEGIQPSIIKDIGRALQYLRDQKGISILLVEQYLDFCRELARSPTRSTSWTAARSSSEGSAAENAPKASTIPSSTVRMMTPNQIRAP
jgi:ABC-type branched-subunit amino acid transport system ATPase component